MSVELFPSLLSGVSELEHHGQTCLPAAAAFGPTMTQPDRGERRFDRVGGPEVSPMFGGEVVEGRTIPCLRCEGG